MDETTPAPAPAATKRVIEYRIRPAGAFGTVESRVTEIPADAKTPPTAETAPQKTSVLPDTDPTAPHDWQIASP